MVLFSLNIALVFGGQIGAFCLITPEVAMVFNNVNMSTIQLVSKIKGIATVTCFSMFKRGQRREIVKLSLVASLVFAKTLSDFPGT